MQVFLHPWHKNDRVVLAELANNIKIWDNVRDRLPHPYLIRDADEFIHYCRNQNPPHVLAIVADGQLAGCIGIELQDDISRICAELGYWIGEPYWGKGIGGEAIRLMLRYSFETFPLIMRIYAKVFEYNKASMRVLEKNYFHLETVQKKSAIKNNVIIDEYVWVKFR